MTAVIYQLFFQKPPGSRIYNATINRRTVLPKEASHVCSQVAIDTCLRIWSREMGSAVPSRVSLLISILRLNLVLTYGIPPEFRGGVHL